jgi:hypothetical protein
MNTPYIKYFEEDNKDIIKYNRPEAIKFFKDLPKKFKKNIRKFNGAFSDKEFGSFSNLIFLPNSLYIKQAPGNSWAYFSVRHNEIYVNKKFLNNSELVSLLLHELAHTVNSRIRDKKELIKLIDFMRKFLVKDNFDGGWVYDLEDSLYDLQEIYSEVYVRYKLRGYTL